MRLINRVMGRAIILDNERYITIREVKEHIITQMSGVYYKNIIVIKNGKVLDDHMVTDDIEYGFGIIPIKCDKHIY